MSFAHGAFIGIGAYAAGVLGKETGISMLLTVPAGAVAAMLVGLITGLPFARLRSIYFCMGSMFMGVAIVQFISSAKITGGAVGLRNVPSLSRALSPVFDGGFGAILERAGIGNVQMCYYIILLVTIFSLACLYRFEHSRIGWILKALSQSPEVASSTGINERYFRLLSVCFGCFFAGLIGAVYAHYNTTLSPNSYSMGMTLWLIMYMMIGGMNNFLGPILGAIILELIKQVSTLLTAMSGASGVSAGFVAFSRLVGQYAAYVPFFTAFILLLVVYCLPGGLVSIPGVIRNRRARSAESGALASDTPEGGNENAS
jgi:branched-chain amino acid transport system permease protein